MLAFLLPLLNFLGGPVIKGIIDGYKAKLESANTTEAHAVDLAKKEIEGQIEMQQEATKVLTLENGRWWTWVPRWTVEVSCAIFFCKCVVWDTVMGQGSTPALGGDVSNTYTLVMGMWFGSRTIEKVARIFKR
jgi:hypothetical protein